MQTLPTLSESEAILRANLEATIRKGKQTFLDVGGALVKMKQLKLYRSTHATFEDWAFEEYGFTRSYACRLIEASEVSEMLPIGNKPNNEGQARALAKAPAEKRLEVMQAATEVAKAEGRDVTAQDIKQQISPPDPTLSGGGEVASAPSAALSRAYSLGAFQEETEGLVDIAVAEFDKDECSKAAGQLEMLAAKLRRRARVLTLEQNPHLKAA